MRFEWNLKTKYMLMVAMVLFVGLGMNTAVLTFVTADRYESALRSKTTAFGEHILQDDIRRALNSNIPLALIEDLNDKLKEIVTRDRDIAYAMVIDPKGTILFHNDTPMIGKQSAEQVRNGETVSSDEAIVTKQGSLYEISFRIRDKRDKFAGMLCLGMKTDSVKPEVFRLIRSAVGISAIIILLGSLAGRSVGYRLIRHLNRVIEGLKDACSQVSAVSEALAASGKYLAQASSEQAGNIEEIASSIEQLSSMTKSNAGKANEANSIVSSSKSDFDEASEVMTELSQSMSETSKASDETRRIIKTIDEIAFQTNLLSLNAAVEAARAGEAGAGFAVVAEEVRNLAMRASEAAKNTAGLIEGIVRKINDGEKHVERVNKSFEKAIFGADTIGTLVNGITAASVEQAHSVEQLNIAVNEMNRNIQQTSAVTEESASASSEMNKLVEEIKPQVDKLVVLVGGKQ